MFSSIIKASLLALAFISLPLHAVHEANWAEFSAAILDGNSDKIKELVAGGMDVNRPDSEGFYPIHYVAGDFELLSLFIKNGADVKLLDSMGRTALHTCDVPECAQLLLEKGVKVNAKDEEGKTALHMCPNIEVAKILLKHGAEVNAKDAEGNTPLHDCYGAEYTQLLLDAGANLKAKNKEGQTPLETNTEEDALEVLRAAAKAAN